MVRMSFKEVQMLYAFHTDTLAYRAGVSEAVVTAMLKS